MAGYLSTWAGAEIQTNADNVNALGEAMVAWQPHTDSYPAVFLGLHAGDLRNAGEYESALTPIDRSRRYQDDSLWHSRISSVTCPNRSVGAHHPSPRAQGGFAEAPAAPRAAIGHASPPHGRGRKSEALQQVTLSPRVRGEKAGRGGPNVAAHDRYPSTRIRQSVDSTQFFQLRESPRASSRGPWAGIESSVYRQWIPAPRIKSKRGPFR